MFPPLDVKYLCLCAKQLAFRFLQVQLSKGRLFLRKYQNNYRLKALKYSQRAVQTNVAILTLQIQNHSGHLVDFMPILLKHSKDLVSCIGAGKQTAKMKNRKQKLDLDYLHKALFYLYHAQKHTGIFIATNRR